MAAKIFGILTAVIFLLVDVSFMILNFIVIDMNADGSNWWNSGGTILLILFGINLLVLILMIKNYFLIPCYFILLAQFIFILSYLIIIKFI
jgi:hypothetical protein